MTPESDPATRALRYITTSDAHVTDKEIAKYWRRSIASELQKARRDLHHAFARLVYAFHFLEDTDVYKEPGNDELVRFVSDSCSQVESVSLFFEMPLLIETWSAGEPI